MWDEFAHASREVLRAVPDVGPEHPTWSDRRYKVFIYDPPGVRGRIGYIKDNPEKEGLEPQTYPFVIPYEGFPYTE
jgi:hypothetical protein